MRKMCCRGRQMTAAACALLMLTAVAGCGGAGSSSGGSAGESAALETEIQETGGPASGEISGETVSGETDAGEAKAPKEDASAGSGGDVSPEKADGEEEPRGLFEEFEVQDLDGNAVTEELFSGYDLTMINIWATYCNICLNDMPGLASIRDDYAERGLQVIGLCTDTVDYSGNVVADQVETARLLAEETGADFLHLVPAGGMASQLLPQLSGVPTTVFVDREGKQVGGALIGARDRDFWDETIEALLE